MAKILGMNPDRVESLAAQLQAQDARLSQVAANVERAAKASASPMSWGIQPGGLVIAPFSIGATTHAATQVRLALSSADELIGRLMREAAQQRSTSNTNRTISAKTAAKGANGNRGLPGWVTQSAYGWIGNGVDALDELVAPFVFLKNPDKIPMFMREQSNGRGGFRYRSGLLQWGRSTYKNNPIVLKYREPRLPGWMQTVGRKTPSWVVKGSRVLGPVGTVLSGALAGRDAYVDQYDRSSHMTESDRHLRSGAAAATVGTTTIAGALGGAAAGAKIGALVGSIFPGPGTAIGAIAGGLIGGFLGAGGGEWLGNMFNKLW